jgi:hypothetical protein
MDAIQGLGSIQRPERGFTAQLTDEQKQTVTDILSKYDPENLTADNAKTIMKAFREAGIQPNRGLRETIESAGFDAKELLSMGRPAGAPKGPPPGGMPGGMSGDTQSTKIDQNSLKTLQSILNQFDLTDLSSEDEDSLVTQLQDAGLARTGLMIDLKS